MPDNLMVDVCIMGAGPVGGTLACRLARAGVSVALIDRAKLPPMEDAAFDGRAYAIAAGSRPLLEDAGLWDSLDVTPNPIIDIRVSDGRVGRRATRLHLHFDHRQAAEEPRPFGWMVEARSLRKALNARFPQEANIRLFAPVETHTERADDAATVRIAGGPTITTQLVRSHMTGRITVSRWSTSCPPDRSLHCRWVQVRTLYPAERQTFPRSSGLSRRPMRRRSWPWMMHASRGKQGAD
jgi:2-octaprenyl-6-methoxyphenol hydroxylase